MDDIAETLRAQAKIFDEMAGVHLRHHYEEMRHQGMKQAMLANLFSRGAAEIERLRRQNTSLESSIKYVCDMSASAEDLFNDYRGDQ